MKLTKTKLKQIIREELLNEGEELSIDDVKNAGKILGHYTKNKSFGRLKWTDDGHYKTSNITNLVKPPFDLIFKDISIRCDAGKNKNGEEYYSFSFKYSHPAGGSNGYSIGILWKKPTGNWVYRKA